MNAADQTRQDETDDDAEVSQSGALGSGKNYLSPHGYERLRNELLWLIDEDRPKVVEAVSWAAKNGDRSENGDYLYGKKRLREIDRRIRFLTKRLEIAEVVDASVHVGQERIYFGATVTFAKADGEASTITILGVDEVDPLLNQVSWVAPIARAMLGASVGDEVQIQVPGGVQWVEILAVQYPAPNA